MRQFVKTRFFALLAESSGENFSMEVYRDATGEFVDELWETCREETDLALLYRKLEHVRIWLESWQEHSDEDGGTGKKSVSAYVREVLNYLRVERKLLHERVEHPGSFVRGEGRSRVDIRWKSKQYKMKVVELVVGLVLVGELYNSRGEVLGESGLVGLIDEVFGVSLKNFSQLKDQLFRHQRELTPFLNQMVKAGDC